MFKLSLIFLIILGFSCNSQNNNTTQKSDNTEKILNFKILPQEKVNYKYIKSIPTPPGYKRIKADTGSFAFWIRNTELKKDNTLYLFNGTKKTNQNFHFAVLNFDTGTKDLQQCADAVIRLRAEYLYSLKKYDDIHFNFLSDDKPRFYKDYANNDYSYKKFRKYLDYIFSYANTASLKKELTPVKDLKKIKPGDVFIQSGKPFGHAVIVVDVAKNDKGDIIFMLAQSYMPAQDINILKNLNNENLSPWYNFTDADRLILPEWEFEYSDLREF